MVALVEDKTRRYFASVINVVVVTVFDGSKLERLLYGEINE